MISASRTILAQAYRELSTAPFPPCSEDDVGAELHADLVLYDSTAAGIVCSLLQGDCVPLEQISLDVDLLKRLTKIATAPDHPARRDAQRYIAYCDLVNRALKAARSYVATSDKQG